MGFVHLHVHSEYSLLDGTCRLPDLTRRAKELGQTSIAVTDHGVMYGAVNFYAEAKKAEIKPIIGCEVYVAAGSRHNKDSEKDNFYYHLVLLAENNEGYKNLIKLVSYGFTEGFYYKPRVDIELLKQYKNGLIALSACLAWPVCHNLLAVNYQKGLEQAILYDEIFGRRNFYIELQDHGLQDEHTVNLQLLKISEKTGRRSIKINMLVYVFYLVSVIIGMAYLAGGF